MTAINSIAGLTQQIEGLTQALADKDLALMEQTEIAQVANCQAEQDRREFKNFHRMLCERFGYQHDDLDWKRDQVSLMEFLAAPQQHAQAALSDERESQTIAQLRKSLTGWQEECKVLRDDRDSLRQRLDLQTLHQKNDVWYWQGDGTDYPESISNSMAVVIRGDQLRSILATRQPAPVASTPAVAEPDAWRWKHNQQQGWIYGDTPPRPAHWKSHEPDKFVIQALGQIQVAPDTWFSAAPQPAAAPVASTPVDVKLIGEAYSTILWLYRRLPRPYGAPPHINRVVQDVAKVLDCDPSQFIAERSEPNASPVDSTPAADIPASFRYAQKVVAEQMNSVSHNAPQSAALVAADVAQGDVPQAVTDVAGFAAMQIVDHVLACGIQTDRDIIYGAVEHRIIAGMNKSYANGVRDTKELESLASQPDSERDAALALAYGILWHVNAGMDAPPECKVLSVTPERAAYEARKALRDMLTHEQRGQGIHEARESLTAMAAQQGKKGEIK